MTNLQKVHFYMRDLESPDHFIDWNYAFAISSTLGRKVWEGDLDRIPIFPNLYLMFVAEPAVGKTLPALLLLKLLKSLTGKDGRDMVNISPDSTTLESLFRQLSQSTRAMMLDNGTPYGHASMAFCIAEELGTLFREKTSDLVRFMTQGYGCGDFKRTTKLNGNDEIKNMCINLLGCCTPDWVRQNVNNSMIEEGFTSRVIALWADKNRKNSPEINFNPEQCAAWVEVRNHLMALSQIAGPINLTPEVKAWRAEWVHKRKDVRINNDRRLKHYYGRKKIHLYKLATVRHYMEHLNNTLTVQDHIDAEDWLNREEVQMHKAMSSGGENPIYKLSEAIKLYLEQRDGATGKRIILDHFHMGDEEQIGRAITFLQSTEQINQGNDCIYKVLKKG